MCCSFGTFLLPLRWASARLTPLQLRPSALAGRLCGYKDLVHKLSVRAFARILTIFARILTILRDNHGIARFCHCPGVDTEAFYGREASTRRCVAGDGIRGPGRLHRKSARAGPY